MPVPDHSRTNGAVGLSQPTSAPGRAPSSSNAIDLRAARSGCTPINSQLAADSPLSTLIMLCAKRSTFSRSASARLRKLDDVAYEKCALIADVLLDPPPCRGRSRAARMASSRFGRTDARSSRQACRHTKSRSYGRCDRTAPRINRAAISQ